METGHEGGGSGGNDGGQGDSDGPFGRGSPVPLIMLEPVHLPELLMWARLAQCMIQAHPQESMAVIGEQVSTLKVEVSEKDLAFTLARLGGFTAALKEIIDSVRMQEAEAELSELDKDKLH